jgi:hypothetical protein
VTSVDEVSVARVLWGGTGPAGEKLERRLRDTRVSRDALAKASRPPAHSGGVLDQSISEVLLDALDLDLAGIVVEAWTDYQDLRKAAARTRDAPGKPERVVLAEHEITLAEEPLVDILIDGARVQQLKFELVLTLTLRGVVAVVDRGALVAVRTGEVAAAATLTLNGAPLARGEHTWAAGVMIRTGDGIPLLGPAAPAGSTPTAAPAGSTSTTATAGWATTAASTSSTAATHSWVHKVSANTPPAPAPSPSPAPATAGVPWWERTKPSGGSR